MVDNCFPSNQEDYFDTNTYALPSHEGAIEKRLLWAVTLNVVGYVNYIIL